VARVMLVVTYLLTAQVVTSPAPVHSSGIVGCAGCSGGMVKGAPAHGPHHPHRCNHWCNASTPPHHYTTHR